MRNRLCLFIILVLFALALPDIAIAQTETPTPTITPTPANLSQVTLTSGSTLVVDRTVTYGDIYITLALLLFVVINSVSTVIQIIDKWTS